MPTMSVNTPFPHRSMNPDKEDHSVNDTAVIDFIEVINTVPVDQWQKRTGALRTLVSTIPADYHSDDRNGEESDTWYSSSKALRLLALPMSRLLKDARSSVVKETCSLFTQLVLKCRGEAKFLLKDIFPTILDLHGQTVTVIRKIIQMTILAILPTVPCKAAIPEILERLKNDKSKTIREACTLYLSVAIASWTEEGYLTQELLSSVGTLLIRAMRDTCPLVRDQAKKGLEVIRQGDPELWTTLVRDPTGPAAKDQRLQKLLLQSLEEPGTALDKISVASRGKQRVASNKFQRSAPFCRPSQRPEKCDDP